MRFIEGEELTNIQKITDLSVEQANLSPCQKSHRGAVIFKDGVILGQGFNAPPPPLVCEGEDCRDTCRNKTVHAEQNAIYDAIEKGHLKELKGALMLHIKSVEGKAVTSNELTCAECSKLVLRMRLGEFVLWQDQGYTAYTAEEFHRLTLESLKNNPR